MMTNNLKLQLILDTIDKATGPLRKITGASEKTSQALKASRERLKSLEEQQRKVRGYHKARAAIGDTTRALIKKNKALSENTEKLNRHQESHDDIKASLRVAEKEYRRLTKAMFEGKDQSENFNAELQKAQVRLRNSQAALEKSASTLKKYKGQIHTTNNSIKRLNDKLQRSQNSMARHGEYLEKAGISTENLGYKTRQLILEQRKENRVLDEQQKKLDKLAHTQRKMARANQKFLATQERAGEVAALGAGSTAAGTATGAGIMLSVHNFAQAENAITRLKTAMMLKDGSIPAEFKAISALAEQLGNRLPGTTADFQNMMTTLKQQGMSSKGILDGLGEATAYIAVQLKMPFDEAAQFTAKLADSTGTTEVNMMGLMDIIQRTRELGVVPDSMLNAFTKLTPAMALIKKQGLEGARLFAPLVAMTDQAGMDGEAAGNAIRKVLQRSMDSQKIHKIMRESAPPGIHMDFTDGKGEFGGLNQMFTELTKLQRLTTETRIGILQDIYGDDAETLQVLQLMISKGQAGYDETLIKMERQASLQQRVNAQLTTLTNVWDAASGTATNSLVKLTEVIEPELKDLINWLGETSEKFGTWVDENRELTRFIMLTAGTVTALLLGFGALALAVSALLGPFAVLRWTLTALSITTGSFGSVAMNMAKQSLPAIGAAATDTLGKLRQLSTASALSIQTSWQSSDPVAQYKARFPESKPSLKNRAIAFWQQHNPIEYAQSLPDRTTHTFTSATKRYRNGKQQLKEGVAQQWERLQQLPGRFSQGVTRTQQHLDAFWQNTKTTSTQTLDGLVTHFVATETRLRNRGKAFTNYMRPSNLWFESIRLFKASLRGIGNILKGGAVSGIKALGGALQLVGQIILFVGRALLLNPIGLIITAIAVAGIALIKYWQPIKAFFSGFWAGLTEGLMPLREAFGPLFDLLAKVLSPVIGLWELLTGALAKVWGWISKLFSPFEKTSQELEGATNAGRRFGTMVANIINAVIGLPGKFAEFGGMLIDGLMNGITSKLGALKTKVVDAAQSISGWFKSKLGIQSPSRVFISHGSDVMAGLEQGLQQQQHSPLKTIQTVTQQLIQTGSELGLPAPIQQLLAPVIPTLANVGNALVNSLPDSLRTQLFHDSPSAQPGAIPAPIQLMQQLLQPVQTLLAPLKQALAPVTAGAALALANPALAAQQPGSPLQPLKLDTRPPLQAARPAATTTAPSIHIEAIHIHAAPGMDERALAQKVIDEINRQAQLQQAGLRSSLRDDD
ncbi:MAG: phage tail tape measure protein [Marinobacterium sp.]|nr:phage tail tape measure protein [Marinobacterium sp.]